MTWGSMAEGLKKTKKYLLSGWNDSRLGTWTRVLQNTKQMCYPLNSNVRSLFILKCIFLFLLLVGWDLRHQILRPLLAYCTAPNDRWGWLWSNWWNEDWQGKPKYSEKTCPCATLSTTNPTWPDPCANTGRRGGKPATIRLSYGAAFKVHSLRIQFCWPNNEQYR
jgi:hypothetical protein